MTQLIKLTSDAYPYGCKGDIVPVDDKGIARLKRLAEVRKVAPLYETVDQSNGFDQGSQDEEEANGSTLNELRARAKELGVSGGGSKDELQARIAEAEAKAEQDA